MSRKRKRKPKSLVRRVPQPQLSESQRLQRRMMRPTRDEHYKIRNDAIDLAMYRHNAEEFGVGIGIVLHWVFVKPVQLVIWLLKNFQNICNLILVGLLLYLGYWFFYLLYVATRN